MLPSPKCFVQELIRMPELLFKLNNVPEDEADDVRQLLEENSIDFYETPGGNWGISVAAIWLHDKSRLDEAKELLEKYQAERLQRVRAEYQQRKASGEQETLWQRVRQNPLVVIGLLALAVGMLIFSIKPFLNFAQ